MHNFNQYSQFGDQNDFGERTGDEHFIMYTGGTTGYPKGVLWRHRLLHEATLGRQPVRRRPPQSRRARQGRG
ncbi:MAG: AMP-binding protein [Marmoricola sp.]